MAIAIAMSIAIYVDNYIDSDVNSGADCDVDGDVDSASGNMLILELTHGETYYSTTLSGVFCTPLPFPQDRYHTGPCIARLIGAGCPVIVAVKPIGHLLVHMGVTNNGHVRSSVGFCYSADIFLYSAHTGTIEGPLP